MVGIDLRNTLDMDATIKGFNLTEENLKNILEEIITIDAGACKYLNFIAIILKKK